MAENSRKNEFFERESIAIIAITTSSSIKVKNAIFSFVFIFRPFLLNYGVNFLYFL